MSLAPYYQQTTGKSQGNKYGFYVNRLEYDRFTYQHFATLYAAKHFLLLMIDGDDYVWDVFNIAKGIPTQPMIRTARGITIRGAFIEDVMEYEFASREEAEFVFPEPEHSTYERFPRLGKQGPASESDEDFNATTDSDAAPKRRRLTPEERAERDAAKAARPKVSKEGLVTVQDISTELKCDPKHARAALRRANVEKPAVGWAWPKDEIKAITKLIKDNLK